MRFRWSKFARAALWLAAGFALARALAPSADRIAAAASPHETPRLKLRYVAVALAAAAAALALGKGIDLYRQHAKTLDVAEALAPGDASAAPALMIRYGCAGCHTIPGVPGADGQVGPELRGLRSRVFVGGVTRNDAADLVRWIVDPPSLSPRTAMPRTGIAEPEAREVAAWLYAH